MGTYFALMEQAAERARQYQDLDRLRDILADVQKGIAKQEEVSKLAGQLDEWENWVNNFIKTAEAPAVEQARRALARLEAVKAGLGSSLNGLHK